MNNACEMNINNRIELGMDVTRLYESDLFLHLLGAAKIRIQAVRSSFMNALGKIQARVGYDLLVKIPREKISFAVKEKKVERKYNIYKRYYAVTAKCGHVKKHKYIEMVLPVMAVDGKKAAKLARSIPRVKHDHKDAIVTVEEICEERYYELKEALNNDPYWACDNVQQQRAILDLDERILEEKRFERKETAKASREYRYKKIKERERSYDDYSKMSA